MKEKNTGSSSCEMPPPKRSGRRPVNKNAFYKHKGDFTWRGVKDQPYKTRGNEWSNIIRRVLIGAHDESAKFHVRYFEIASGGRSSPERHRHEHVVICVRGEGLVTTGKTKRKLQFMDTIYISPDAVHQLANPFTKPFGFLCIVNAKRDRPKVIK